MPRRYCLFAVLSALLVAVTFSLARPALSAPAPVRIMPLGDSITAGPGCWRAMLWRQLQITGYPDVDFVGGASDGGGCNPGYSYDWDHEGHGGYSATGIADNNQLPPWLSAARPDIVLMHLGTNDMWGGYIALETKLAAFTKLIGQMRTNNPSVKVVVAKIIPMSQAACATCPADVVTLNNAIPGWAAGLTTNQSPIFVADLWTGFDAVADTSDGVHPITSGFQKMANGWYPALTQALSGGVPPRPTASATAPVSPTRSASASASASVSASGGSASCTATATVVSQWGGNFQGEVVVKNTSATAATAWTATLTFANGQQISQSWNAALSQSGATVTARNVAYNGSLAAGGSTTFGFLATWNDITNAVPTTTCRLTS